MAYYKFVHKRSGPSKYIKTDVKLPTPVGVLFYTDELTGAFVPIDHDEYYQPVEFTEEQYNADQNPTSPFVWFTEDDVFKVNERKCECGLDITGKGGKHSTWCMMWGFDDF
jgi:hypothetical protein